MQKVLGSHTVTDRSGQSKTTAVLECGHEVDYAAVKWAPGPDPGGVPEAMAECPVKEHDGDGKALRAAAPAPPTGHLPQ